jgi:hypothetical protein
MSLEELDQAPEAESAVVVVAAAAEAVVRIELACGCLQHEEEYEKFHHQATDQAAHAILHRPRDHAVDEGDRRPAMCDASQPVSLQLRFRQLALEHQAVDGSQRRQRYAGQVTHHLCEGR